MRNLTFFFIPLLIALVFCGCVPDDPNPNPNPASPDFLTAQRYPTGAAPLSVRTADFNGDGKQDIVTANRDANSISVILSGDDPAFALHTDYAAGTAPTSLVVANLIGSAAPDILCVNNTSANLSLFQGNGDGTFAPAVSLGLLSTSAPIDAAAGDLDGDGDNEIVTADSGTNSISIFKNNGAGFDAVPVILPVGNFPRAVLLVDLNKDGKLDIVVVNRNSDTVSVLLANAVGFAAAVAVPTGENPRQAEPIDVDGDSDVDLVVTNPTGKSISILINNGAGDFSAGATINLDALPSRCDSGDFNGDGKTDLAMVMFSTVEGNPALGQTTVLYGNGTGGFPTMRSYGLGGAAQDLVVADMNGDARPDIVAADAGGNNATILAGRAGGAFASDERISTGQQPREVAPGDLDKDGDLDLVVISQTDKKVRTYKNDGAGGFSLGSEIILEGTPRGVAVGLLNADDIPDVAVSQITGTDGVRIFPGKGDATLLATGATIAMAGRDPRSLAIGDVNKDGKRDIVTGDSNKDQISVLLGDGAGAFAAPTSFDCGNFPMNVNLLDTNADGNLDVVFLSRNDPDSTTDQAEPRVVRVLGKGNGTFDTTTILRVATGADPRDLTLGDISGDGLPDAVVASASLNNAYTHIIGSNGAIQPGTARRTGTGPRAALLPDIGANNKRDIVTINGDNTFTVITNFGSNAFTMSGTYYAGNGAIDGATGDFNKDGKPDLILLNQGSNDMSVVFGL